MRRSLLTLLDSHVKLDNHLVWDGKKYPFFESYDIKLYHPKQDWSLWVRYALNHPTSQREDARAELAGIFMDGKGTRLAISQDFSLLEHDVVHANHFMTVGDAHFSLADAAGRIESGENTLRWELCFEDPVTSTHPLPGLLYQLPVPYTKFLSPRFTGFVSGQVFIDHHVHDIQHLRVYQSHRYQTKPSSCIAWAHCANFEEDETAVFEALTVKRDWPKNSVAELTCLFLQCEGERFSSKSLLGFRQGVSMHGSLEWHLEFEKNKKRFEGHIVRTIDNTRRVPSVFKEGQSVSYVSPLAAIEIKIYKKQGRSWEYQRALTSRVGCTYETVSLEPVQSLDGVEK